AEAFSSLIRRPSDCVARYGAGRFAVVLGGTPLSGALEVAETLRLAVQSLRLPHPASPTGTVVTISIGVASIQPLRDRAWQDLELIALAEKGLVQARGAG